MQGHRFYKEANFFSAQEVIELLTRHRFKNIVTAQTIFKPVEEIKEPEISKSGFGEGGFVVICGNK